MRKNKWKKSQHGTYLSDHILVTYLGDKYPEYHILGNPDGEGWVLGYFDVFYGEYLPVEDLIFNTLEEAKYHVDVNLIN